MTDKLSAAYLAADELTASAALVVGDKFYKVDATTGDVESCTGTQLATLIGGNLAGSTGGLTSASASAGIGYATGAGGTVTQTTNRSTGVTLSKVTGQITTDTTSLAAGAAATFTVTNTAVAATDVVVACIASGETTNQTNVRVTGVAAGSFDITVENNHASTAETGAIVINFAVIKGVTS